MKRIFRFGINNSRNVSFLSATAILFMLNLLAYLVPINLIDLFGTGTQSRMNLIGYAPEVWLSLLAFVFGTLIIVISIASGSTPKLIDQFVGDFKSRLFIWLIALSSLENILLQLIHAQEKVFFDNLIFLNNYCLLPFFIIMSIPYIFYILKYTKDSNVIRKIYSENQAAIKMATRVDNTRATIDQNHMELFDTVNQMHDLLQYVKSKEPKAEVIHRLGKSLRLFLRRKKDLPDYYFVMGNQIKKDISFRTLSEKFEQVEAMHTFYEHKVMRMLGTCYLVLMQEGHYDLASLCGNELCECGRAALEAGDTHALDAVVLHFNTFIRHGINYGLRTKEIKNVYNTVFHFSSLAEYFISRNEIDRVIKCSRYFAFYGNEVCKLARSEPSFLFLVGTFATELRKILMRLHDIGQPREVQGQVLALFNDLTTIEENGGKGAWRRNKGYRLIQIILCLYYISKEEDEFVGKIADQIMRDFEVLDNETVTQLISTDCERILEAPEEFWEDTDQGNQNIYFSHHKDQVPRFRSYFLLKLSDRAA